MDDSSKLFSIIIISCLWFLLRFFQAGAKHVYAVEASDMADYARKLISGNPALSQRITVSVSLSYFDLLVILIVLASLIDFMMHITGDR